MRSLPSICLVGFFLFLPSLHGLCAESLLEELLRYEAALLAERGGSPTRPAPFGSDPFAVIHVPETGQNLLMLRNTSEVLLLDSSLHVTDRKPTPRSPHGWTLVGDSRLVVAGELSNRLFLYRIAGDQLVRTGDVQLLGSAGIRDVTYVPSTGDLFAIDSPRRRLIRLAPESGWRDGAPSFRITEYTIGAGPLQIRYADRHLFVNLLLDHRIEVLPLTDGPDFTRKRSIVHNGPIWDFDTHRSGNQLLLAVAGVEDRPLDRTKGEFGYIDSFLYVYRMPMAGRDTLDAPQRFISRNLSADGVVTPKTVRFEDAADGLRIWVLGFGSDRGAVLQVSSAHATIRNTFRIPPGSTDLVFLPSKEGKEALVPNTLLDRVYRLVPDGGGHTARPIVEKDLANHYPSTLARIGEILFFTTLLSPANQSEGQLSRFTCETCHFEGTIDGRVHFTGRDRIFATTKTLRGLANNVPLFSRAGDRSLAAMVLAEFHVANQNRRDQFWIDASEYPWLRELEGTPMRLAPLELRKSFLAFFVNFPHKPNPWLSTRNGLSSKAVAGLRVFQARCEHCHRATPSTRSQDRIAPEKWPDIIQNESSDVIWGAPFYTKTNILPYVSKKGTRVPSLRRVSEKYPYFTNGSSRHLRGVLARFRYRGAAAWHHHDGANPPDVNALSPEEVEQLEELLRFF